MDMLLLVLLLWQPAVVPQPPHQLTLQSTGPRHREPVPVERQALLRPSAGARRRAPTDQGAWPRVHIDNARTRDIVIHALEGAYEWLAKPRCRDVLSDFHDEGGRPLAAALAGLEVDLPSYLRLIVFVDGFAQPRCGDSDILALTMPRNRVVYICGRSLERELHYHERWTRAVLIHEALHTLGLGENPPSSGSITATIVERCGR